MLSPAPIPTPIREFGVALALLTRVPAGWIAGSAPVVVSRAVWAFPLVGALLGALAGLVVAAGAAIGMPPALGATWALAAAALLGGGLHEDGLADLADGFGGGGSTERKLQIMRDSRIGSYGALALILATAARLFSIAALGDRAVVSLAAAGALSRGSMALPLLLLQPARSDGLGKLVDGAGWRRGASLGLGMLVAVVLLPPVTAAMSVAAAGVAALAVCGLARRQIGGFTGDVLGGCAVVAECAALSAMASA